MIAPAMARYELGLWLRCSEVFTFVLICPTISVFNYYPLNINYKDYDFNVKQFLFKRVLRPVKLIRHTKPLP